MRETVGGSGGINVSQREPRHISAIIVIMYGPQKITSNEVLKCLWFTYTLLCIKPAPAYEGPPCWMDFSRDVDGAQRRDVNDVSVRPSVHLKIITETWCSLINIEPQKNKTRFIVQRAQ